MYIATNGSSWASFKPGTKRRRTKAEIFEQNTAEQLRQKEAEENIERIKELEEALAKKTQLDANNANAADILNSFIANGECELLDDGNVRVSKSKNLPNTIGNLSD